MLTTKQSSNILTTCEKKISVSEDIYWVTTMCSRLHVSRRLRGKYSFHRRDLGVSREANRRESSGQLQSFEFQPTIWRYVTELCVLHNHQTVNAKSYSDCTVL
jgi:hypothetical protein